MAKQSDHQGPALEDLMRRAQQGDKAAYADLFRAITPLLRAFVTRRLGIRGESEDVVQNILLALHHSGRTYDSDRPFKMWMFAIARHCLSDHLRQLYRRGASTDISLDHLAYEIPAADVTETQDRREYLNDMLNALSDRQRKIVTMMKIEGHSAEDTARTMKMSVSAVKVAAHRAYKALALQADALEKEEKRGHG